MKKERTGKNIMIDNLYKNNTKLCRESDQEVTELTEGMDFRLPKYRREVFHRFYQFHLEHKSHAGMVYQIIPWIAERYGMTLEEQFWYCFINGCTHIQ